MSASRTDLSPSPSAPNSILARFHASEQGDEGVNKILIIALIVVPLVIVILLFGKNIKNWFGAAQNNITNHSNDVNSDSGSGSGSGMSR